VPDQRAVALGSFVRVGTLVMLVHDVSDVFLESAKIFNYISAVRSWAQVRESRRDFHHLANQITRAEPSCRCCAQMLTDGLFVAFAVTFGVSRLGVFPMWIIHSTVYDAPDIIPGKDVYPAMYVFYTMLFVLQALHIFWCVPVPPSRGSGPA
jgi:hypothetical protein